MSRHPFDPATGEVLVLDAMTDVERRMSIVPLSELLPRRHELVERVAVLRAKHAAWGTWDATRKIELSRIKMLIRAQATVDGRKVSTIQIDDEAHAHTDYIEFVTLGTTERADWVRLEVLIEAIDFTINRGQSIARFLSAEAFLTPRTG